MTDRISDDRQRIVRQLKLNKNEIIALLPPNVLDFRTKDPLVKRIQEKYLAYSQVILDLSRHLAKEAGYLEVYPEDIRQIRNYGPIIDVIGDVKIVEYLIAHHRGILVDAFESGDDIFIYIFDPDRPRSSPTIAIHEGKSLEEVFQAEMEQIQFSRKDKLVFSLSVGVSLGTYLLLDEVLGFVRGFLNRFQTDTGQDGTPTLTLAVIVGLVIILRFGGAIVPKSAQRLFSSFFSVRNKNKIKLKTKYFMTNRTDSRRVFVDLYTQASMPITKEGGNHELMDYFQRLNRLFLTMDGEKGFIELLEDYWTREERKWTHFPRVVLTWLPFLKRLKPSPLREGYAKTKLHLLYRRFHQNN